MPEGFTFYKGVSNYDELREFLERTRDLPECESFKMLVGGEEELIKGAGYIAQEDFDDELYDSIPNTLKEALG